MSTLSWNRLLSFCSLNLSIKLFPLCSLNISSTAVECRMVVFSKTQIFVATEYSKSGIYIAMNERTVIIVSCQSSYVCCASCTSSYDNHRKCTCRVHYSPPDMENVENRRISERTYRLLAILSCHINVL